MMKIIFYSVRDSTCTWDLNDKSVTIPFKEVIDTANRCFTALLLFIQQVKIGTDASKLSVHTKTF